MPQSSLMTWLSKPATVKEPAPVVLKQERHETKEPDLPTPPLSDNGQQNKPAVSNNTRNNEAIPFLGRARKPLPLNISLLSPTKANLPAFKQLNTLLLPIPYPESFYRETLTDDLTRNITLFAFWHDSPPPTPDPATSKPNLIGAIRCRIFAQPLTAGNTTTSNAKAQHEKPMLYLSTLVLLSPYRGYGVATHLLDVLVQRAVEDYGVGSIGAHVWEANGEGLEWYRKRGFREVGREEGYYRRLKPSGAVVVRREVGVMDFAGR